VSVRHVFSERVNSQNKLSESKERHYFQKLRNWKEGERTMCHCLHDTYIERELFYQEREIHYILLLMGLLI
jgi:hypothetical protein